MWFGAVKGSDASLEHFCLHDVVDEANGFLLQVIEEDLGAGDRERDDVLVRILSGHDRVPVDRATCETGGADVERSGLGQGLLVNPQAGIVVLVQGHGFHDAAADGSVHGRQVAGDVDDSDLLGDLDGDEDGGDGGGVLHALIVSGGWWLSSPLQTISQFFCGTKVIVSSGFKTSSLDFSRPDIEDYKSSVSTTSLLLVEGDFPLAFASRLARVAAFLAPSLGAKPDSVPKGVMDEFAGADCRTGRLDERCH